MNIKLKNTLGQIKQCKVGFSWTTLFFSFFPALFRGDIKWGAIQFVLALITGGLSALVFCFIYNKLYINDLLSKGYEPISESDREILVSKNYIVA